MTSIDSSFLGQPRFRAQSLLLFLLLPFPYAVMYYAFHHFCMGVVNVTCSLSIQGIKLQEGF